MLPEMWKEKQISVASYKSGEQCVSGSWTIGLCEMVVKSHKMTFEN